MERICSICAFELDQAGSPIGGLRVGGGGAHSRLIGQLKAEVLGLPVLHLDLDPAGFGAAMLAASAAGMPGEAAGAIAAVVARALVFGPTGAGSAREAARFAWFSRTKEAGSAHRPASTARRSAL